ncbi:hypothetical protein MHBO_003436, partial [Bonamia ostreae]
MDIDPYKKSIGKKLEKMGFSNQDILEAFNKLKSRFLNQMISLIKQHKKLDTIAEKYEEIPNDLKAVFIVNSSLSMKKGKVIAQCCHAYDGILQKVTDSNCALIEKWRFDGAKKIVLKCNSLDKMLRMQKMARKNDILNYFVTGFRIKLFFR